MIIFLNKQIVFHHVPKNAGTSIRNTLLGYKHQKPINYWLFKENKDLGHPLASEIFEKHTFLNYENFFLFACVRNPYERSISAYLECKRNFKFSQSFNSYLNIIKEKKYINDFRFIHGAPQYNFLYHKKKIIADYIVRFENLEQDYKNLYELKLHELGEFKPLKKVNQKKYSKDMFLNRKNISLINNIYKLDFLKFHYNKIK